jgi:SurA N-terminal domain
VSALGVVLGVALGHALAAQASPIAAPRAERDTERVALDAVAAVVDRKVITVSEVEAEARLALLEKAGPAAADGAIDARFLRTLLDHLITQELLAVEARRTLGATMKEGVVDAKVQALRDRFTSPEAARAFLQQHGIDEELLRARARRDLMNQALVSEVLARAGAPTDDEVRRVAAEQGAAAQDAARLASVREDLLRARREQAFSELMLRLKGELDVRVVAAFADGPESAAGSEHGPAPAHGR